MSLYRGAEREAYNAGRAEVDAARAEAKLYKDALARLLSSAMQTGRSLWAIEGSDMSLARSVLENNA